MAEVKYSYYNCQRMGHSKQFFELIRALGDAKSKQEEEAIVANEIGVLKRCMREPGVSGARMKEFVVRMLHCEMVGASASFGFIHAINLASSPILAHKRAAYSAVRSCLPPCAEEAILLVSTMRSDIASKKALIVCAGLDAAARVTDPEILRDLVADVRTCLRHDAPPVRRKAVTCLHSFWKRGVVNDTQEIVQMLSDRDPSVMGCGLLFVREMALSIDHKTSCKHLVKPLASILRQLTERRLPHEYEYCRLPAPWMQICILQTIRAMCAYDAELGVHCREVLAEVIRRGSSGNNIGCAVVSEAVAAVAAAGTPPSSPLLSAAVDATARFMAAPSADVRCFGIRSLRMLAGVDRGCAAPHQKEVMAALAEDDGTVRAEAVRLLRAMATRENADAVVAKLLEHVSSLSGAARDDLAAGVCQLCADLVADAKTTVSSLNGLIAAAAPGRCGGAEERVRRVVAGGAELRYPPDFGEFCIRTYLAAMKKERFYQSDTFAAVAAFAIGRHHAAAAAEDRGAMVECVLSILDRSADGDTQHTAVSALVKISGADGSLTADALTAVRRLACQARDVSVQQLCNEVLAARRCCGGLHAVGEEEEEQVVAVDRSLAFLSGVVEQALAEGKPAYTARELDAAAATGACNAITAVSGGDVDAAEPQNRAPAQDEGEQAAADHSCELDRSQAEFARRVFGTDRKVHEKEGREERRVRREERARRKLEKEQRRQAKLAAAESDERRGLFSSGRHV